MNKDSFPRHDGQHSFVLLRKEANNLDCEGITRVLKLVFKKDIGLKNLAGFIEASRKIKKRKILHIQYETVQL